MRIATLTLAVIGGLFIFDLAVLAAIILVRAIVARRDRRYQAVIDEHISHWQKHGVL